MKRTAILLLVLALLLTACSQMTTPETGEASVTTTQAPDPTEPATEPATEPTTEPVRPNPDDTLEDLEEDSDTGEDLDWEEPETTEPAEPEPTLPQEPIDWQVHTDWSQYRPYSGSQAKYTRLRSEPLDHFEPLADYGAVFPYVAAQTGLTAEYMDWGYGNYYSYGIVDRTGCVLTDGIYRDVAPLYTDDWEAGKPNSYWKVCRMVACETKTYEYDGKTYRYASPDYRYGLISMDGSRVLECRYTEITDLGCGLLCRNSEEDPDFEVLSYDLEPLFTDAEVFRGADECDWWRLEYSEGMLLTQTEKETDLRDENGNYLYTTWKYVFWFCGEDGHRVCGPFAQASGFSEGLACASVDGEHYGYIDRNGAWAIEPIFGSCHSFRNGQALQRSAEGRNVVIDRSGSVRFQLADGDAYSSDYGYRVIKSDGSYNNRSTYYYYDFEGNLLFTGNELTWLEGQTFCGSGRFGGLRFFTPERELITVATQNRYPEKGAAMKDGELLMGWYVGWDNDYERRFFVPADYSELIEISQATYPTTDSSITNLRRTDPVTGETWYFCWTGKTWEGRTEAGDRITVPLQSCGPEPAGDLVVARTDQASYLLTREGEIVFCCPFDTGD